MGGITEPPIGEPFAYITDSMDTVTFRPVRGQDAVTIECRDANDKPGPATLTYRDRTNLAYLLQKELNP